MDAMTLALIKKLGGSGGGGGSSEKEWRQLAVLDFSLTENQIYSFEWTDQDEVTEVFMRGSKVENNTATDSQMALKINGIGVASAFVFNKKTGSGTHDYGYARFNGLFWECRSSAGSMFDTMITANNGNAKYPYSVIMDVGKAKTVGILTGGGSAYNPVTGTLEIWVK